MFELKIKSLKSLRKTHRQGFTLIEVMIAVVVFSVGMMAVLMLQFSAINAYSSSRDVTQATDAASRITSLLKVEIEQNGIANTTTSVYTTNSPFSIGNLEAEIRTNPWAWVSATPDPVNEQLGTSNGRYCVFVRGDLIQDKLGANDASGDPTSLDTNIRAHIAVVFPAANREIASNIKCSEQLFQNFGCSSTNLGVVLDPAMTVTDTSNMELCGLRAIYTSSIINL